MHTLPTSMVQLLAPFTLLFSERVWRHAQVLLVDTILAPPWQEADRRRRPAGHGLLGANREQYRRATIVSSTARCGRVGSTFQNLCRR